MHRRQLIRWLTLGCVGGVLALGVGACGSSGSSGGGSSGGGSAGSGSGSATGTGSGSSSGGSSSSGVSGKSVVFVPGATGVAFYNSLGQGVQSAAKKLGMSYSTQGAADFSPSAQTPVVNGVCTKQPDLLIVAPTDPEAMRSAIQRCMNEGVKVVTVDTGLSDTSGLISAITSNNIQGGEQAGELIGKDLHGSGQVALMSLSATATTQVQRLEGAKKALKKFPNISIAATEYTQQAPSSSLTTARSVMSGHSGVKAFFGAAEPNAEGVAQAVGGQHILNVGYDAAPPEVQLLKSGKISALVIQQPVKEGQLAVQYGADALKGDSSAIKKSVTLPNVLVTTAQANSARAKKYYYSGS